jgi:hypothetical protein
VKRRELVVDLHRHDGLGGVVQLDVRDRADVRPANPNLVAVDELAGALEDRVDPVAATAPEHGQRQQGDRCDQRRNRNHAGSDRPPLGLERFASPAFSCR